MPTWLLNRANSEWRWLLERDDSPWYPNMRIVRQQQLRVWPETVARLAELLRSSVGLHPDKWLQVGIHPDEGLQVGIHPDEGLQVGIHPDEGLQVGIHPDSKIIQHISISIPIHTHLSPQLWAVGALSRFASKRTQIFGHSVGMPYSDLRKGRVSEIGATYHVITRTHRGVCAFADSDAAAMAMRTLHTESRVETIALCVMPDHVHWLFVLQAESLSRVVGQAKARTARKIGTSSLWQPAFYDHRIRSDEVLETVCRYILSNPLSAGICSDLRYYTYWYCSIADVVCPRTGLLLQVGIYPDTNPSHLRYLSRKVAPRF